MFEWIQSEFLLSLMRRYCFCLIMLLFVSRNGCSVELVNIGSSIQFLQICRLSLHTHLFLYSNLDTHFDAAVSLPPTTVVKVSVKTLTNEIIFFIVF